MRRKVISFKSVSERVILSAFAIALTCTGGTALVLSSAKVATAETHEQSVNNVTDWLFGNLHPELNRRKLRADERGYIREWQAIRTVINQRGLRYQKIAPSLNPCGLPDWSFANDDEALKERLADAVFYSRYSRRIAKPIVAKDSAAVREWLKLKNSMFVAYC
ncbi:MAG: hypothetical protein HC780_13615 [Leptolyngbyaceae cyanobacterium CSU_1_3]|nr:hypothetical protein [Leptolyngbyaceae cyanobacterium CSU_1_3]